MLNKPDAMQLLDIARETLLHELPDALPEEHRHAVRMVASAMAIAAREASSGDAALEREHDLLAGLYGEGVVEEAGHDLPSRVAAMNRRFAKDIRAGTLDGACAPAVRLILTEQVKARLRVSNPKYLLEHGLE